jgi:hypothetical protein
VKGLKELRAKRLRRVLEASLRVGILILGTGREETDGDRVNLPATDGTGDSSAERKLSSKFPLLCTVRRVREVPSITE